MTARPGTIEVEIPILLERSRQQLLMMSPEFLALRRPGVRGSGACGR
jgi:hypothetical protein